MIVGDATQVTVVASGLGCHDDSDRQLVVAVEHDGDQDNAATSSNVLVGAELMVPVDPELSASDGTVPAPEGNTPRSVPTYPKPPPDGMSRLLAFALVAGLIAGAASLVAGEAIMNVYKYDLTPKLAIQPAPEDVRRWHHARIYSAAFTFATLGAILGLAMGLAGGLARRWLSAGAKAAIGGLVLGAAIAGCVSLILVPIFFKRYDPQSNSLVMPLLTHGAIWSTTGAVGAWLSRSDWADEVAGSQPWRGE